VRLGLISDTHGLLRPEALEALRGSDKIIHAGDIGGAGILDALRAIAPVRAVRGNNDRDAWARALPEMLELDVGALRVCVIHDRHGLVGDPKALGYDIVVTGHSHKALIEGRDGVLYVNPGSAGPQRFGLPITVGRLSVEGRSMEAELVTLALPPHPEPLPKRRRGGRRG
jgi:hypothetical protein